MCPPKPPSQLGLRSGTGEGEASSPSLGLSSQCPGLLSVPGAASEAVSAQQSGKWIFLCGPPALSPEASLQKGVDFIKRGSEPSPLSEDKPELGSQKPKAPPSGSSPSRPGPTPSRSLHLLVFRLKGNFKWKVSLG